MIFAAVPGVVLVVLVLWDVFESIVLPRRVTRRLRPARIFYRSTWAAWRAVSNRIHNERRRETVLGFYGPLSLIMLLAAWAVILVFAFAVIQWSFGSHLRVPEGHPRFRTDLYLSGTTFFTLGLGDVVPNTALARAITVIEAGTGFGFLALVIGYVPVFYQSFSRREVSISLLDGRAGSPPTAGELLRRYGRADSRSLSELLLDWERWAADLLETHLSYPVLAYFRSQHERQSWVAALTAILDVSAIVAVRGQGIDATSAHLTFAMARHAAVDLSQIFVIEPRALDVERLTDDTFATLWRVTSGSATLTDADRSGLELASLRATYEPYVNALAEYLEMPLPPWIPADDAVDAWQTSPVESHATGIADPARRPH